MWQLPLHVGEIAPEVVHEFKRIVEESAAMSRPNTADGPKAELVS
jgi:hypothetical protein